MKKLFIPVMSKNTEVFNINEISKKLPKNIAIAYSIQFKKLAINIRDYLEKNKAHKITLFTQVLGCSKINSKNAQALLLIGQGRFHALGLAIGMDSSKSIPIYIYEAGKLVKMAESDVSNMQKRQKVAYMKYLNANNVGIMISTKPGQNRLNKAIKMKNSIKNKNSYLFIANNINPSEFENFPEIKSWINTACPRMDLTDNNSLINMDKIE